MDDQLKQAIALGREHFSYEVLEGLLSGLLEESAPAYS